MTRPRSTCRRAARYPARVNARVVSVAVARAFQSDFDGDFDGDFERALSERLFRPLRMDGAFVARRPADVRLLPGHLSMQLSV